MARKKYNKNLKVPKKVISKEQTNEELSFIDYSKQVKQSIYYFPDIIQTLRCDDKLKDYCPKEKDNWYLTLDFLWYNLPVLNYIVKSMISYIFSDELTTGNEKEDKILHTFLQATNINCVSNELVLKTAIKYMLVYGQSGIRWLSKTDGIDYIKYTRIGIIEYEDQIYKAIQRISGYVIAREMEPTSKAVTVSFSDDIATRIKEVQTQEKNGKKLTKKEIEKIINQVLVSNDNQYIYLPKEEMVNLRDDISLPNGEPILYHDRQRIQLIATVYDQLIKDLTNEGFGRVLLYPKKNIFNVDEEEKSGAEILKMSANNWNDQIQDYRKELIGFMNTLVNSKPDSVTVVPNNIEKHFVIEKKIKSTDFLEFITITGETIAQVYGMNPALFALGALSGNVSMAAILDSSMKNIIIPLRNSLIIQISEMLSQKLGIGKIYFAEYKSEAVKEEADYRKTMSEVILNLSRAGLASQSEQIANKIFGEMPL